MPQTFSQLIADWLSAQSQHRGFTVEKSAAKLGVRRTALYAWMSGKHFPSPTRRARLAKDMRIPVQVILDAITTSENNGENQ